MAQVFWHQSEARTAVTVWNWSGKTFSPGALLAVLYFSSCHIFFRPFRLFLVPTICPWVSEDGHTMANRIDFRKNPPSAKLFNFYEKYSINTTRFMSLKCKKEFSTLENNKSGGKRNYVILKFHFS